MAGDYRVADSLLHDVSDDELEAILFDSDDDDVLEAPIHPIPSMQGAFDESILESIEQAESGHPIPKKFVLGPEARRQQLLDGGDFNNTYNAKWRKEPRAKYHPLSKVMAQIAFGIHLLHRQMARSDDEVIRILQRHIDEVDNFVQKTEEDLYMATTDILERMNHLKLPLDHVDIFDVMLEDREFRLSLLDGNEKIERIVNRTSELRNDMLVDIGKAIQSTKDTADYLTRIGSTWPFAPSSMELYHTMLANTEGWLDCFNDLQMQGHSLGVSLTNLGSILNEMARRAGIASRKRIPPPIPGPSLSVGTRQPKNQDSSRNTSRPNQTSQERRKQNEQHRKSIARSIKESIPYTRDHPVPLPDRLETPRDQVPTPQKRTQEISSKRASTATIASLFHPSSEKSLKKRSSMKSMKSLKSTKSTKSSKSRQASKPPKSPKSQRFSLSISRSSSSAMPPSPKSPKFRPPSLPPSLPQLPSATFVDPNRRRQVLPSVTAQSAVSQQSESSPTEVISRPKSQTSISSQTQPPCPSQEPNLDAKRSPTELPEQPVDLFRATAIKPKVITIINNKSQSKSDSQKTISLPPSESSPPVTLPRTMSPEPTLTVAADLAWPSPPSRSVSPQPPLPRSKSPRPTSMEVESSVPDQTPPAEPVQAAPPRSTESPTPSPPMESPASRQSSELSLADPPRPASPCPTLPRTESDETRPSFTESRTPDVAPQVGLMRPISPSGVRISLLERPPLLQQKIQSLDCAPLNVEPAKPKPHIIKRRPVPGRTEKANPEPTTEPPVSAQLRTEEAKPEPTTECPVPTPPVMESPKPQPRSESPQPQLEAEILRPEPLKIASPKPELRAESAKPQSTTDSPEPRTSTDLPHATPPRTASPRPEAKTGSYRPDPRAESPQPQERTTLPYAKPPRTESPKPEPTPDIPYGRPPGTASPRTESPHSRASRTESPHSARQRTESLGHQAARTESPCPLQSRNESPRPQPRTDSPQSRNGSPGPQQMADPLYAGSSRMASPQPGPRTESPGGASGSRTESPRPPQSRTESPRPPQARTESPRLPQSRNESPRRPQTRTDSPRRTPNSRNESPRPPGGPLSSHPPPAEPTRPAPPLLVEPTSPQTEPSLARSESPDSFQVPPPVPPKDEPRSSLPVQPSSPRSQVSRGTQSSNPSFYYGAPSPKIDPSQRTQSSGPPSGSSTPQLSATPRFQPPKPIDTSHSQRIVSPLGPDSAFSFSSGSTSTRGDGIDKLVDKLDSSSRPATSRSAKPFLRSKLALFPTTTPSLASLRGQSELTLPLKDQSSTPSGESGADEGIGEEADSALPMPMPQPKVRKVGSMGRLKKFIGLGRRGRTAVDTGPWT